MVYVTVAPFMPHQRLYTYQANDSNEVGSWVKIPFGRRSLWGIIWGLANPLSGMIIKSITQVADLPPLSSPSRAFLNNVADHTLNPLSSVLTLMLSPHHALLGKIAAKKICNTLKSYVFSPAQLSPQQCSAAKSLRDAQHLSPHGILLEGVTGSGKTEVYFELIADILQQGKQVLVLLPEIGLLEGWVKKFKQRWQNDPWVWHGSLGPARRRACWRHIAFQHSGVVVGTRSALFLPFTNLGLVIVDEEHDLSYKQTESICYHGRDLALLLGNSWKCPVVLVSATPSLESLWRCQSQNLPRIVMGQRYQAALPRICFIPGSFGASGHGTPQWISHPLRLRLQETLQQKKQSLLFLNRRGYAPFVMCWRCRLRVMCHNCHIGLVWYMDGWLRCHGCGHRRSVTPCDQCQGDVALCGPGIQRVAEEVKAFLDPRSRLEIISRDHPSTTIERQALFKRMEAGEIDILVGTQLVTKGHHFPNLTLVGIIDGDAGLHTGDLRAWEKTYQMLHQVSGRAGRSESPGEVMIQSHTLDHPVHQALASGDIQKFIKEELTQRRIGKWPPYSRLVACLFSHAHDPQRLYDFCQKLAEKALYTYDKQDVLGPMNRGMLRRLHRVHLLIKVHPYDNMAHKITTILDSIPQPPGIIRHIDVDPYTFF